VLCYRQIKIMQNRLPTAINPGLFQVNTGFNADI